VGKSKEKDSVEECLHVMQARCFHCDREHYGPSVYDISHGELPCGVCNRKAPVFTSQTEYLAAKRHQRDIREKAGF